MAIYKLVISVDIECNDNDIEAKEKALSILEPIKGNTKDFKVTLTRENDRSAKNILLPKIEGRLKDHYPSRKATLSEVLKKEER